MGNEESSEGNTTADSSSVSSDGDEEVELQSMTARGVQHLCSELLELKQESDEDFQKNISSNYSAFLAIMKDIEVLQCELLGMKEKASLQKKLVKDVSNRFSSSVLSEENVEAMLQETQPIESSSPTPLDVHKENVSELLDNLLSEHRLDDAVARLEMEVAYVQKLRSGKYSSDQMMSYNSTISEKMAMVAEQLALAAKHPRVSAPELQKALRGLCQLGDSHLANQIMLQHYHSRIASGISNLQSSKEFPDVLYIHEAARVVCSMISQAVRSFVALNGEARPYSSELTQWTTEEIEVFSVCFIKYIESISDISGRLSTAIDALQIGMSYCSLLETQRIYLKPYLAEFIRPCVESVLKLHINHLSKVISMVTSTDSWVLGRYNVSGILTERTSAIINQLPECFFLTNSGRKFVTLFQSVAEEISHLIKFQMESSVLEGIMDLFTAYVAILESAITGDTEVMEQEGFSINLPENPTQGVFILANLSTLMQFSLSIIRKIFDGIPQLDIEIGSYAALVHDIYSRLKSCFLGQFITNIFSPNADHESSQGIWISRQDGSRYCDVIPSVPYLELYLELQKLQKLAEDDCLDMNWLMSLFTDFMDATFEWMSSKPENWTISTENVAVNRTKFMQLILDTQFLVEMARRGAYLSDNAMNISKDIISRVEEYFVSAGLSPLRDLSDEEWPASAAIRALYKLQELHAKEPLEDEDVAGTDEEGSDHPVPRTGSVIPVGDDWAESVHKPVTQVSRTEESQIEEVNVLAE